VVVKLTFNQQPVSGAVINASVPDMTLAQLDESSVTTDDDGIATFKVTDIKAEKVAFTAEYNDEERVIEITFIGDKNTAELVSEVVIDNALLIGGSNEIAATLKDYFNNGLQGESVIFSSDSSDVKITPETSVVDSQGVQKASIEWIGSETITSDPNINITSSYTKPNGDVIFVNNDITFSTAVFEGLFIDVNYEPIYTGRNKVHAKVSLSDGSPAVGIPVTFSSSPTCSTGYNGEKVVNTNEQGVVNITLSSSIIGNCTVTASALGEIDTATVYFREQDPKIKVKTSNVGIDTDDYTTGTSAFVTPAKSGQQIKFTISVALGYSWNTSCRFANNSTVIYATTEQNGYTPAQKVTRTDQDNNSDVGTGDCWVTALWVAEDIKSSGWILFY
ncbi:Ig-like domain-containing protein, partial [Aliivibrio salmonicida]|uniref:Ig-like domain-containing protein n=1 Tax=Aliivibrio salmonicida TaxID=40269 RepID=UPI003D1012A4